MSTLHPRGVTMYILVHTCSAVFGLYLAVVNCCQVLCCLRAQHPLCCSSWLIWGGSTVCHSLALTCWICLHGLVRKTSPLLTEVRKTWCHRQITMPDKKCAGSFYKQGSLSLFLNTHPVHRENRGYYSDFKECMRCFTFFTFKLQGVTKWNYRREEKNRTAFIQYVAGSF